MKKYFFLLFISCFFISCSSDDSNSGITKQNLLGKWKIIGGTVNGNSFEFYEHDCSNKKDFQEFFDNGNLTFNGYDYSCNLVEVEPSLWELEGNQLTISNTNFDPSIYEYIYIVEKLTTTELILKQTIQTSEGTYVYRTTFSKYN